MFLKEDNKKEKIIWQKKKKDLKIHKKEWQQLSSDFC